VVRHRHEIQRCANAQPGWRVILWIVMQTQFNLLPTPETVGVVHRISHTECSGVAGGRSVIRL